MAYGWVLFGKPTPVSAQLSARRNYQRGGFALLSVTAAEWRGCEPGIETRALREVRMQTCSAIRPFSMTTIWSAVLKGGEPMSNHDGGALVRDTIERLPPQSFARGVARAEVTLSSSSPGAFFTIARGIARRWRRLRGSLRACQRMCPSF